MLFRQPECGVQNSQLQFLTCSGMLKPMHHKKGKKKKRHSKSEERKTELLNLNTHLENKAWKLMFILGSRKMYKKMLYKKSLTESAG